MSDHQVWNELGNVYTLSGELEQAVNAYTKALEINPKAGWTHNNIALAYIRMGQPQKAIEHYQRSIELFENFADKAEAWHRLGSAYETLGDIKNTLLAFERATELAPEKGEYQNSLVAALEKLPSEVRQTEEIASQIEAAVNVQERPLPSISNEETEHLLPKLEEKEDDDDVDLDPGIEALMNKLSQEIEREVNGDQPSEQLIVEENEQKDEMSAPQPKWLDEDDDTPIEEMDVVTETVEEPVAESKAEFDEEIEELTETETAAALTDAVEEAASEIEAEIEADEPENDTLLADAPVSEEPAHTLASEAEMDNAEDLDTEDSEEDYDADDEYEDEEGEEEDEEEVEFELEEEDIDEFDEEIEDEAVENSNLDADPAEEEKEAPEQQVMLDFMQNATVWGEMGNVFFSSDVYDGALIAYQKALELDENQGVIAHNLALLHMQRGEFEEAIELYQKSIDLLEEPAAKAISWNHLGNAYRALRNYEKASEAYRNADEINADAGILESRHCADLLKAQPSYA